MKITCKQQDLSRGLSIVSHSVSNRTTLPILANILLATDNGRLRLSATNLEIGINCWVAAQVEEEGSTTVPAKTLTELVNTLPPGDIDISEAEDSNRVNIKTEGSNANIKGIDASEFPLIPSAEGGEPPVTLDAAMLKEMIAEVVIAASDDESRPVFTGVLVQVGNERITFAAADAFRLAVRIDSLPGDDGTSRPDILVPAKTMQELSRVLPSEGSVQMIVTPNRSQVLFHTDTVDLVSRLIDGNFPNYNQIIPKEHTTRAVLDTKEFAAHVKRAAIFARDSSNITRLKISSESGEEGAGKLIIEANADDLGDNVSELNARVEGPDQQIIFNVRYLSDVLAVLDVPQVAIEVNAATKPGVIRPEGENAANYTYVIMPMHVNK